MSASVELPAVAPAKRLSPLVEEAPKVLAFLRRDFLIAISYRAAFVAGLVAIAFQALIFYYVGRMVNPAVLPEYGGERVGYMEFVTVGMALGTVLALGLGQVAGAVRTEQLTGTLESLLMTPTAPGTIQVGSVAYPLAFIPLRTALFIGLVAVAFGLDFTWGGAGPAAVVLLLFVPFVWGLGLVAGASILTFKRGGTGVGFGSGLLVLGSGVYFPLDLLPRWVQRTADFNPLALSIEALREALLAGATWSDLAPNMLGLLPASALSLGAGLLAFRLALRRERRRGTVTLY